MLITITVFGERKCLSDKVSYLLKILLALLPYLYVRALFHLTKLLIVA